MAYLAPSLVQLRNENNAKWPNRDKTSDGWIGDERHRRTRSEHNPDARGCVHAIDVDRDGIDPMLLVTTAINDPRTWYVIWNRRIYSRSSGFKPRHYTGRNPHTAHIHISILLTRAAETDVTPWFRSQRAVRSTAPRYPGRPLVYRPGLRMMGGSEVRTWQARVRALGFDLQVDGWYGPRSAGIARQFQRRAHLVVDGVVGPKTWAACWANPR